MTLAGAVHKKILIPQKAMQEKMEKVQEICEEMEKISDDALSQFFQVMFEQVTDDELAMVENRLVTYGKMMLSYIFEMKARGVLDCAKLPHAFDIGWHTFKSSPSTWNEEERKRVTLKAFDDCVNESNMEEVSRSCAELYCKIATEKLRVQQQNESNMEELKI